MLRTFHRWGGLVFIVNIIPNWRVVRILSHLMGYFLPLSNFRLIRDNWKAVIENHPTSLIGEIWFDLQDKQLLGIILLPLLVRFGLIYRISSYWEISYFSY